MAVTTATPARRATDLPATPALLATYSDVLWADANAQAAWADYRAGRGSWQTARYWQAIHRAMLRGYLRLTLMEAGYGVGALERTAGVRATGTRPPAPPVTPCRCAAHHVTVTDRGAVCRRCGWTWITGPGADLHLPIISDPQEARP